MRISVATLILIVTIAALVCAVAVQSNRSEKQITSLESALEVRELKLAQSALAIHACAMTSEEKSPTIIAEAVLSLWAHGNLVEKHREKLDQFACNPKHDDENPAVRANALLEKFQLSQNYIDEQIDNLIKISDIETIQYLFSEVENPNGRFGGVENSPTFESREEFIRRLKAAFLDKTDAAETISSSG